MTATLDRRRNYGDSNGTTSDPILIAQLGTIHGGGSTPEETAAARRVVNERLAGDPAAIAEVNAVVFGDAFEMAAAA